jgi:hypothetical protein
LAVYPASFEAEVEGVDTIRVSSKLVAADNALEDHRR